MSNRTMADVVERVAQLAEDLRIGPRVEVHTEDGRPARARAFILVHSNVDIVWSQIETPENLARLVRMIESVRVLSGPPSTEHVVRVDLKFKIALFSARFHFVADVSQEPGRWLELRFREGKIQDVYIRLELVPVSSDTSILECTIGFDMMSLGWLVKTFLRHHPEIEWGVHAGSVLTVCTSVRDAAEAAARS